MLVRVHFYSYFKDLTGCSEAVEDLSGTGAQPTIEVLLDGLGNRFPAFSKMRASTLVAVGLQYQPRDYVLREGDEVSFFPPVQGG